MLWTFLFQMTLLSWKELEDNDPILFKLNIFIMLKYVFSSFYFILQKISQLLASQLFLPAVHPKYNYLSAWRKVALELLVNKYAYDVGSLLQELMHS